MVPSWANQLLKQLLMEQFDTLPIQYRHIEHTLKGVWLNFYFFGQNGSYENLDDYSLIYKICMDSAFMVISTPTTAFDGAI